MRWMTWPFNQRADSRREYQVQLRRNVPRWLYDISSSRVYIFYYIEGINRLIISYSTYQTKFHCIHVHIAFGHFGQKYPCIQYPWMVHFSWFIFCPGKSAPPVNNRVFGLLGLLLEGSKLFLFIPDPINRTNRIKLIKFVNRAFWIFKNWKCLITN